MDNQNKPNRKLVTLLIALLLLLLVGNIYQWKNHTTTVVSYDSRIDSMIFVRVEVEKELASTEMELEKYRGISADLDSLLNSANLTIKDQERKIQQIVNNEKNLEKQSKKLKAELAVLKKLRDEYLEKIDQLVTENKELKAKNDSLNLTVNNLSTANKSLETKVKSAAVLKIEYVKVKSYKKKGSGKLVESSLAKRTNKIEVCFTVMDNKFAATGDKIVYLVITEPTGKILAGQSKASFISTENTEVAATASYQINYSGKKEDACIGFETEERILTSGNYNFDLYIDGEMIASAQYLLE